MNGVGIMNITNEMIKELFDKEEIIVESDGGNIPIILSIIDGYDKNIFIVQPNLYYKQIVDKKISKYMNNHGLNIALKMLLSKLERKLINACLKELIFKSVIYKNWNDIKIVADECIPEDSMFVHPITAVKLLTNDVECDVEW